MTDTVLARLTSPDLLNALLATLMRVMVSDNAAILLLDPSGQNLTLHMAVGPEEAVVGRVVIPVGKGVAGRIVASGKPLIVDDLRDVEVANPLLRERFRSLVGVPLTVAARVIGALHVDSVTPARFGAYDSHLLQLVADRVALALDRAHLFSEVEAARAAAAKRAGELEATLEGMSEGVVVYDDQARITYENATMSRLLAFDAVPGYRSLPLAERARLLKIRDAQDRPLSPEELPPMRALLGESFRESRAMDLRLRSLRGEELWFQVSAAPVRDEAGRIVGASSVWRDVTQERSFERERAALLAATQASLAETQEAMRQLQAIQSITDASLTSLNLDALLPELLERLLAWGRVDSATVLLLDEAGTHLRVSAARGLEEEVAVGVRIPVGEGFAGRIAARRAPLVVDDLKMVDVFSPFLREKLHSAVGVPLLVDDRVIGLLYVGSSTGRPFTEQDTHLIQLVAERAARGIDRARLLDALRAGEERFRATFEQAAVGMARIAPDGAWLDVNQRLCDIVGYTRAELLAGTFQQITYPSDLEADLALFHEVLAGQIATYSLEKRYIRKDGSLVWINVTVSLVRDAAGAPRYFVSVIEDISERKAAQAALRELTETLERRVDERTAELAEANADLEAFGYSVSHDLRAPLRAMAGFANALLEDNAAQLDAAGRAYASRIVAAAGRMDNLIQDLLAYSRLSRGELQPQRVELATALAEARRLLAQEVAERGAQIRVEGGLQAVWAHLPTLAQVLANLLGNAMKFVSPGVSPLVRVRAEERPGAGVRRWVRVWVEDNGIGIAPEHQERIFRVFERLHGSEAYPGTGIGLAIVRKGVERMGGRAGVESLPGEGSRFWIELPAADDRAGERAGGAE